MSAKKKQRTVARPPLTEREWDRVFAVRCKSKQGQLLTDEERRVVDRAYETDQERYGSLEPAVFNATAPFGSTVRR